MAIVVAAALFAVSFANGEPWLRAGLVAVTFAMAAIPWGFPLVMTSLLSRGAWRLVPRDMVVRRMAGMETLGSATVISIDEACMPNRPEVPSAVDDCRRAGIRVIMVTADDKPTARAVAAAANLPHDDASIVSGDELESLDEGERALRIQRATVFARVNPAQKFLVVDGLQRAGAVVAMTGDGVSDGAALRRADVGIVSGRGTDAARAAADIVLLDDKLAPIVDTIRAARHVLQCSQRALLYLVAFHLPIVVLAIVAPLAGVPLAVLPIHVVWLGLLALAVATTVFRAEDASPAVMTRPPRDATTPLLPGPALLRSALSGGIVALGAWAAYAWRLPEVGEEEARAMALIVLVGGNQTLMFAERLALPGLGGSLLPGVRVFWLAWCGSVLSLAIVLYVPPVARLFSIDPPTAAPTLAALALGVLGVGWRLIVTPGQSTAPAGRAH